VRVQVSDRISVFTLQMSDNVESIARSTKRIRKHLNKQLRLEHINNKEKKAIEKICEDFCDIFHLENDTLTFMIAVAHKITTKVDSAPVN